VTAAAPPAPRALPRAGFRDLLAAEWLGYRSLRATWAGHAATALAVLAVNAGTAYDTHRHWAEHGADGRARFVRDGIPLQHAFTTNAALLLVLAMGVLGAVAVAGDHASGALRTTFAAVPGRPAVMAARAVVVAAVATAAGTAVAAASFGVTQAILARRGAGVSIGDPGALRVVAASALLAPVCALAGLALGTLLRRTASSTTATVVVLVLLPVALTDGRRWSAVAGHALPWRAWLRLTETGSASVPYPWTVAGAWTVYAVWAVAAGLVTAVGLRRGDL
jgi:hypothetical protein